jgi:hypothetical protein
MPKRKLDNLPETAPAGGPVDVLPSASQSLVARMLNVDVRTVRRWESADPPLPRQPDGAYDVVAVVRWAMDRQAREAEAALAAAAACTEDASPALERWREARAAIAEIELAERRGAVVRREDVDAAMSAGVTTFTAGLQQLRELLCQAVPEREHEVSRRCDEVVERVRGALACAPTRPAGKGAQEEQPE